MVSRLHAGIHEKIPEEREAQKMSGKVLVDRKQLLSILVQLETIQKEIEAMKKKKG
jgi:hypothetical protein